MIPITLKQINGRDLSILDPEFLITTCLRTHDAIHYSDSNILYQEPVERVPGDTKLW